MLDGKILYINSFVFTMNNVLVKLLIPWYKIFSFVNIILFEEILFKTVIFFPKIFVDISFLFIKDLVSLLISIIIIFYHKFYKI